MPTVPVTDRQSSGGDIDDEISLFDLLQVLAENARLLVLGPLVAAVAALCIGFATTPTFTASATFLPPQQQQGAAAAMLQSLGAFTGASGAGGAITSLERYVAFAESRSVRDAVIERFDLKARYGTRSPEATRSALRGNTRFSTAKNGLITVEITDTDPRVAADIANAEVEELTKFVGRLALTEAQARRAFFEQQLKNAKDGLVAAEISLKATGVNESAIKANPAAAVGAVASLMAQVAAKEVEIGAIRSYLTDSAPDLQRAQAELRSLRSQLSQVDKGSRPAVGGSDYVSRYRDFKYYEALYELMAKQYEMARIDESRDGGAIQVVDMALPPEHKSAPKKAQNALLAAVATGVLLVIFVFARQMLRSTGRDPNSASKLAAIRETLRRQIRRF